MHEKVPKQNLRGDVLIRGEVSSYEKVGNLLTGLKSNGERLMPARDIFGNEERNRLDQVRYEKLKGKR